MKNFIHTHPFISFVLLAYAISWPLFIIANNPLIIMVGGFGPWISAFTITAVNEGMPAAKKTLKKVFRFRTSPLNYLLALVIPMAVMLTGYRLFVFLGGTPLDFGQTPPLYLYPMALLSVLLVGGGQEEPGWRGFALPTLMKRFSPLTTSVIIGLVWAFWHTPLFFNTGAAQASLPMGWYLVNVIAWSTIATWLHQRAKGKVFIAMLLHAGMNAPASWLLLQPVIGPISLYGSMTLVATLLALFLAWRAKMYQQPTRISE